MYPNHNAMNNLRFATLLHIFSLLAFEKKQWLTSEWMAGSININAVVVRRELAWLKSHGFVESRKGKDGGVRLVKDPSEILLGDVLRMVVHEDQLLNKKNSPNPDCPVGRKMNEKLDLLYNGISRQVFSHLDGLTLESFIESI